MLAKILTVKVISLMGAGVLTVGTAAAATVVVPAVLQDDGAVATGEPIDGSTTVPEPTTVPDPTTTTASPGEDDLDADGEPAAGGTGDSVPDEPTTTTQPARLTVTPVDPTHPADDTVAATCPDGLRNHGEYVSGVARSSGSGHGAEVSEAARSDCGKESKTENGGVEDGDDQLDQPDTETQAAEEQQADRGKTEKTGKGAHKGKG